MEGGQGNPLASLAVLLSEHLVGKKHPLTIDDKPTRPNQTVCGSLACVGLKAKNAGDGAADFGFTLREKQNYPLTDVP